MKVLRFAVILSSIIFFMNSCNKPSEFASVYFLDSYVGSAQVSTDGGASWNDCEIGMSLAESNWLRTGEDSFCDIVMPEKGILRVSANTMIQFAVLNDKMNEIDVANGKLVVNIAESLSAEEQFKVESATAVVAVRGTEFVVNVRKDGSTAVSVNSGRVAFRQRIEGSETNDSVAAELEDELELVITNAMTVELTAAQHRQLSDLVHEIIAVSRTNESTNAVNRGQLVSEIAQNAREHVRVRPVAVAEPARLSEEFSELSDEQVRVRMNSQVELQSHRLRPERPGFQGLFRGAGNANQTNAGGPGNTNAGEPQSGLPDEQAGQSGGENRDDEQGSSGGQSQSGRDSSGRIRQGGSSALPNPNQREGSTSLHRDNNTAAPNPNANQSSSRRRQ